MGSRNWQMYARRKGGGRKYALVKKSKDNNTERVALQCASARDRCRRQSVVQIKARVCVSRRPIIYRAIGVFDDKENG